MFEQSEKLKLTVITKIVQHRMQQVYRSQPPMTNVLQVLQAQRAAEEEQQEAAAAQAQQLAEEQRIKQVGMP